MSKVQYWEQEEEKAVARVRLVPGDGTIIINDRSFKNISRTKPAD